MQRFCITLLALLITQALFGQKKNDLNDKVLFEKALALAKLESELLLHRKMELDSAKINFDLAKEIQETIREETLEYLDKLIDNFPNSNLIFSALSGKAGIELQLKRKSKAINTLLTIANRDARGYEKTNAGVRIPYTNYKNRALKKLAKIALSDTNYAEAIRYLDLAKKCPFRHSCGNAYAEDEIDLATMYVKSYIGLNEYQKASDVLLPNILDDYFADNSELIKTAYQLLSKKYPKEYLKTQFEQAFQNVTVVQEKKGKYVFSSYYIDFLNTKIEVQYLNFLALKYKDVDTKNTSIDGLFSDFEGKSDEISRIYKKTLFYELVSK